MNREQIKTAVKKLPPLPLVTGKLNALLNDPSCSAHDVTKVLMSDQALAGKVLKLANSPFYGLSGKIGSVSRAVVILGFSAIRSLALGFGVVQAIRKVSGSTDPEYFWSHALFTASAARILVGEDDAVDPEEAFVAGLVHDIGRLILEIEHPGLGAETVGVSAKELLAAERRAAGMAHTKVSRMVMRHWRFPEALVRVARAHHEPDVYGDETARLTAIVQFAESCARVLGQNLEPAADEPDPVDLAQALGVPPAGTGGLLARTCQEVRRTRVFLEMAGVRIDPQDPRAHAAGEAGEEHAGRAVVAALDTGRAAWIAGLLATHGWEAVAPAAFVADPACAADLALVDARSAGPDDAGELLRACADRAVPVALCGPVEKRWPAEGGVTSALPMAFTREELQAAGRALAV